MVTGGKGAESAADVLTAAQRRALAATLIRAAGDLISTRDGGDPPEVPTELPDDIGRDAAAAQLGRWLAKLPGAAAGWDDLLVWPSGVAR